MLFWKKGRKKERRFSSFLHIFKVGEYIGDGFEELGIPVPLNDILSFLCVTVGLTLLFLLPFLIEFHMAKLSFDQFPEAFSVRARFSLLAAILSFAAAAARLATLVVCGFFRYMWGPTHKYSIYLQYIMRSFADMLFSVLAFMYFSFFLQLRFMDAINQSKLTWTNWANEENVFKVILIYLFVTVAVFIEKIILYFITDRYEAQSQESRINMNTVEVVEKLRVMYYGESEIAKRTGLSVASLDEDVLNSREIAYCIFSNVKGHALTKGSSTPTRETKGLTRENFEGLLSEREISLLFEGIDFDDSGDISKEELAQALKLLYQERRHTLKTRMDASSIFQHLENGILMVAYYYAFVLATYLFGLPAIAAVTGTLGFGLFAMLCADDTLQDFIKTGNVIFFIHPFDIGDRIIYGDTTFTIKGINFLFTEMVGPSNTLAYLMNYKFDCDKLTNIRRSDFQSETIGLNLSPSTVTEEKLSQLEAGMNAFLGKNSEDYMPRCSFGFLDFVNKESVRLDVSYTHKGNFNDSSLQGKRCRAFNRELYKQIEISGLVHGG